MSILSELEFTGDFSQGFSINLTIYKEDELNAKVERGTSGKLPKSDLDQLYQQWSESYQNYLDIAYKNSNFALKKKEIITNIHTEKDKLERQKAEAFSQYAEIEKKLLETFKEWLNSSAFSKIKETLKDALNLNKTKANRILIKSNNSNLRKLPWQKWNLLDDYVSTEIGLTSPNFCHTNVDYKPKTKVKILVILGKDANIHQEIENLQNLSNYLEIKDISPQKLIELDETLWHEHWDILLFNGHSNSISEEKDGEIQLDSEHKITISRLRNHLKQAIKNGLQLAIFNSCKGLGIAYELTEGGDLHIPQILVMRELLPVNIAPLFLSYFFEAFTNNKSFYQSVREARNRLGLLEAEYPASSWLPIICQNTAIKPPLWKELYHIPDPLPKPKIKFKEYLLITLTATALILGIRETGLLESFELKTFDFFLNARPVNQKLDDRIVIVEVTEEELEGKNAEIFYSISDLTLAKVIRKIKQGKPKVIGLDLFRDIPLGKGNEELVKELQKTDIPIIGTCGVYDDEDDPSIAPPPSLSIKQIGYADLLTDKDGIIRRQLLAVDTKTVNNTKCFANKSLAIFLSLYYLGEQGFSIKDNILQIENTQFLRLKPNSGGYHNLDSKGYQILFNPRKSRQTAPMFSVTQILDNNFDLNLIKDKIVLIGVTAESAGDYHNTINHTISGVEVHAQMISQILDNVIENKPLLRPLSAKDDLICLIICGLGGGLFFWKLNKNKYEIIGITVIILGIASICYILLIWQGLWLPFVPMILILPTTKLLIIIGSRIRVSSSQSGLTKGVKNSHHIIITHGSPFTFLSQTTLEGLLLIEYIESHTS
jgi:CHASE2 domain-containing sensor protein